MTRVSDASAGPCIASGPVVAPFCWAAEPISMLVGEDPILLSNLLRLKHVRMHLIGLVLAHMDAELRADLGRFLLCGPAGSLITRAIGRGPPAGLSRALSRMPSSILAKESYCRLIEVLDHQPSAHLLFYADTIDDVAIELLYNVPAPLRRPALLLAMRRGGGFPQLARFAEGLAVLAARGAAASFDALVVELGAAWGPAQFASKLEDVIERLTPVDAAPPPRVGVARRQDTVAEVRAIADRFDHYVSDYLKPFKQGHCSVYLCEEDRNRSAVCLVGRHGRFGWFLEEVKGSGQNADLEPAFLASIQQAFASAGIPKSSAIEAIERLYYWGG